MWYRLWLVHFLSTRCANYRVWYWKTFLLEWWLEQPEGFYHCNCFNVTTGTSTIIVIVSSMPLTLCWEYQLIEFKWRCIKIIHSFVCKTYTIRHLLYEIVAPIAFHVHPDRTFMCLMNFLMTKHAPCCRIQCSCS